jgi:hypothetical protein
MNGALSGKSAVCRPDRGLHATFSSWQKSTQPRWESVVLSGFPTAGEPSLSRCLRPGTEARALPSNLTGIRLPLPRDDIPPQFL